METKDKVEIRKGMQSVENTWGELAFIYIGTKNKELGRIHDDLVSKGVSVWDGVTIIKVQK